MPIFGPNGERIVEAGPATPKPQMPALRGERWAVIWKAHDKPVVRNYLWSAGIENSAELVLGQMKEKLEKDPKLAAKSVGGTFFPVRLDMVLEVYPVDGGVSGAEVVEAGR